MLSRTTPQLFSTFDKMNLYILKMKIARTKHHVKMLGLLIDRDFRILADPNGRLSEAQKAALRFEIERLNVIRRNLKKKILLKERIRAFLRIDLRSSVRAY